MRFDAQTYLIVQTEARLIGVPMAQFIREAAVARALLQRIDRPDTKAAQFRRLFNDLSDVRDHP